MSRNRKRTREILAWGISALVVLSMLCSLVAVLNPSRQNPTATPTRRPASTATVTPTPSPGPNGTATPIAMLGNATPPQAALPVCMS